MRWSEGICKQNSELSSSFNNHKKIGRPCSLSPESIALALQMRREGRPIRFIADELGASRMSVWRVLISPDGSAAERLRGKQEAASSILAQGFCLSSTVCKRERLLSFPLAGEKVVRLTCNNSTRNYFAGNQQAKGSNPFSGSLFFLQKRKCKFPKEKTRWKDSRERNPAGCLSCSSPFSGLTPKGNVGGVKQWI